MFLVMGITGKVGGATAKHLLAQGKEVRALVRNREKAAKWADEGVQPVDGDWNDSAALEMALRDVEGAFVMLPTEWAPSPDYKEAKAVIASYVAALELGSMVSADEVATQLGEVLKVDVKAFAVPRGGWPAAFEQLGIPKGQTGPAEAMYDAVNSGWMDLGVAGTEHVPGTTSARDVFAAAQKAATA